MIKYGRGLFTQACSPGHFLPNSHFLTERCMVNFCQTTASPFLNDLNDILSLQLRAPVPTMTGLNNGPEAFFISSAAACGFITD